VAKIENATPQQVYDALVDDGLFKAWSGHPCNIKSATGDHFEAFGEHCVSGKHIHCDPGHQLIQLWRIAGHNWPEGHYSTATFSLSPSGEKDTEIDFTQDQIPWEAAADLCSGWYEYYWNPLNKFFKDPNTVKDKQPEKKGIPITHADIPAKDLARAEKFYTNVFGWSTNHWQPHYYLFDTQSSGKSGINGGLLQLNDQCKQEGVLLFLHVPDVDEYAKKIVEAGGKIVKEKHAIDHVGLFVNFLDTEGNCFGLYQPKH